MRRILAPPGLSSRGTCWCKNFAGFTGAFPEEFRVGYLKMVSAAKYARAERDLKAARPLGEAASVFYDQAEVTS